MASLKDVILYILENYPFPDDLSNARLNKIIFLSDWHQAIKYSMQITEIQWYFDHYGPYVKDVINEIEKNPQLFDIKNITNCFGQEKKIYLKKDKTYVSEINENEKQSLNHVIEVTKSLNFTDFIKLVYSTYPIMMSEKYTNLDLIKKAKEYAVYKSQKN